MDLISINTIDCFICDQPTIQKRISLMFCFSINIKLSIINLFVLFVIKIECCVDIPLSANSTNSETIPIQIPLPGSVRNWQSFLTFMSDIPNPAGKYKPIPMDNDGYIPVANYKYLLSIPQSTLEIYQHGIPPYKKKNTYLFVSNKNELFVIYDKCKNKNLSLLLNNNAVFFEQENKEIFLHCEKCIASRNKKYSPLKSSVEWKLKYETIDDENKLNFEKAYVWIKLDASTIKNPALMLDDFSNVSLERLVAFYCSNSFRLSHPKLPTKIEDLFVLGKFSISN